MKANGEGKEHPIIEILTPMLDGLQLLQASIKGHKEVNELSHKITNLELTKLNKRIDDLEKLINRKGNKI